MNLLNGSPLIILGKSFDFFFFPVRCGINQNNKYFDYMLRGFIIYLFLVNFVNKKYDKINGHCENPYFIKSKNGILTRGHFCKIKTWGNF